MCVTIFVLDSKDLLLEFNESIWVVKTKITVLELLFEIDCLFRDDRAIDN